MKSAPLHAGALVARLARRAGRVAQRTVRRARRRILALLGRLRRDARDLNARPELPRELLACFPMGSLALSQRPVKPRFLDHIRAAFAAWQRERAGGCVALVGDQGMGKSTALGLLSHVLEQPVCIVAVGEHGPPHELIPALGRGLELPGAPATEAELIEQLARILPMRGRHVLAIDDCHLLMRSSDDLAAWDTVQRIAAALGDRIFVVLALDRAAWRRAHAAGAWAVTRVVHIPPWTGEALRRLIVTRMRRARYRVRFARHVVATARPRIRTPAGYFRALAELTGGNPRAASHAWLRSLRPGPGRSATVHTLAVGAGLERGHDARTAPIDARIVSCRPAMRRKHLFEFGDLPWFPTAWHRHLTDYLQFIQTRSRAQLEPFAALIRQLLARSEAPSIVDLCSGGAGPWPLLSSMLEQQTGAPVRVVLTDLSPNLPAFEWARTQGEGRIDCHAESVDATDVPASLPGVRTIFNGFHHLQPELARGVLADAARQRRPIGVFELGGRHPGILAVVPFVPLLMMIATPFLRPFRPGRLFWTYIVPVMPLVTLWDSLVSALRVYSVPELEEMTRSLATPGYEWEVGQVRLGPATLPYVIGYPVS